MKLTAKLLNHARQDVLLGAVDVRQFTGKVKKDLERRVDLDNELVGLARERLRATNPSAFARRDDIIQAQSKDLLVRTDAQARLAAQLKAIQDCKTSVIADIYKGVVKLSSKSSSEFLGDLDYF